MKKHSKSTEQCPFKVKNCPVKRENFWLQCIIAILVLLFAMFCWTGCGVNHYMAATMVDRFGDTTGFTFIEYGKGNVLNYGN